MTKVLMDRSLHHEMALEQVREKAKLAEEELFELKNWKVVTEQKFKLAERARDEYQKMTEELKKVLEDKKNDLRQAKERAVQEYRDSDALLSELKVSYNDGFDDALRQAKALYPKLDFSSVNITIADATSVHPDLSDDTNELFAEEVPISVAPEIQTEEEKAREAKDSTAPDVWKIFIYFVSSILRTFKFCSLCTGLRCIRYVDILTYLFKSSINASLLFC